MAKLSAREIVDAVKDMTILELKEITDLMKEELGIDPSAVAVAAAPAQAQEDEGSKTKTVVLKSAGGNKIQVIKILKEIMGIGLVEAKGVADNGGNVKENIPADEAETIKTQLTDAGAEVELV